MIGCRVFVFVLGGLRVSGFAVDCKLFICKMLSGLGVIRGLGEGL